MHKKTENILNVLWDVRWEVLSMHLPFFTEENQSAVQQWLIFIITSLTFSPAKFSLQLLSDTAEG